MSEELKRQILDYLREHNTMTLATFGEGGPWAAALFYANDGFTLYFLSDPSTRHAQHIALNPQVALTINEDYQDWRAIKGIQMEGRAELVQGEEGLSQAVAAYVEKYPFVAPYLKLLYGPLAKVGAFLERFMERLPFVPSFAAPPTRFYKVSARRVWFIDNEKGLGHREELPIS